MLYPAELRGHAGGPTVGPNPVIIAEAGPAGPPRGKKKGPGR